MRKLLRSYWFWVFVLLVAAAATWALWPEREYPFTVSADTTYFTAPLNPDGTVDYVAALNERFSKGVTPENNAAPLLIRALGANIIDEDTRKRVFELLQMEPVAEEGLAGRSLEEILKEMAAAGAPMGTVSDAGTTNSDDYCWRVLERAVAMPWSDDDLPPVATWLKANRRFLTVVREATNRRRLYVPLVPRPGSSALVSSPAADFGSCADLQRMFVARAMNELQRGKVEEACADLLAAHRLARLFVNGSEAAPWGLFGIAIEFYACDGDRAMAVSGKLSAAQSANYLRQLEKLSEIPYPWDRVLYERLWAIDLVAMHYRGESSFVSGGSGDFYPPRSTMRWDRELRKINGWFDRFEAGLRKPIYAEAKKSLEACTLELYPRRVPRSWLERVWADIRHELGLPDKGNRESCICRKILRLVEPEDFRGLWESCKVRMALAKTALALELFRQKEGRFPVRLGQLAPDYVKSIPVDSLANGPLIYKRVGKGYLLYSVGPNMTDDGGVEDADTDEDDIAVRVK